MSLLSWTSIFYPAGAHGNDNLMKITQLMLAKGFGGAERYFADLSRILAETGHDVQVICHNRFKGIDQLKAASSMHVESFSPLGWWDVIAQHKIRSAIARHKPDIVQAHLARGAYIAGKACASLNIPLIVKTHNYVDLKYYKNVHCFIATTADQQQYLLTQGIDNKRIEIIPNFSSLPAIDKVMSTTNKKLVFASYGRMVRKKGFHILVQAFRTLIDSGLVAELRIGGDGPEQKSLESLCNKLGLDGIIKFTGWVEDVTIFLKDADIFVLPSLDEPFGITVLEAMAMGKPIIATRTRGPSEILDDDIAYLVEPGDIAMLANMLNRVASKENERRKKAEHALETFRQKYTADVVVPRLIALYKELAH